MQNETLKKLKETLDEVRHSAWSTERDIPFLEGNVREVEEACRDYEDELELGDEYTFHCLKVERDEANKKLLNAQQKLKLLQKEIDGICEEIKLCVINMHIPERFREGIIAKFKPSEPVVELYFNLGGGTEGDVVLLFNIVNYSYTQID